MQAIGVMFKSFESSIKCIHSTIVNNHVQQPFVLCIVIIVDTISVLNTAAIAAAYISAALSIVSTDGIFDILKYTDTDTIG